MSEDNNNFTNKNLSNNENNLEDKDSSEEKILHKLRNYFLFIIVILIILTILIIHYKTLNFDPIAKVLSALIAAAGVFAGFYYNKREKYKEIVTKERIDWLHKMQENLSEYLVLTSSGKAKDIDRDKVRKLYYEIILNINHENDKEALDAIKIYNDYIFGRELVRNIKIRKGIIELESQDTHEVKKFTYYKYKKNFGKLRSNVEKSFAEIFKNVWEDIKEEAD